MEKSKREIATLVPFYLETGVPHFFLQKRDVNAPTYAGYFGFFGGGVEDGETSTKAITREVREELLLELVSPVLFSRYETCGSVNHVFFSLVEKDFNSTITICEGEYGAFFTLPQLIAHEKNGIFLLRDLLILKELSEYLVQDAAS